MEDISYNVYYAVRNTDKKVVLYDIPSKDIDGTSECVRLEDMSDTTRTQRVSSVELGIHQLVHTVASNPGKASSVDDKSYPLKNVGYDGKMDSPKESIITKFKSPHLSTVSTTRLAEKGSFLTIPTYVGRTFTDPISNYLLINLETDKSNLSDVYSGVDIETFHENIQIGRNTLELVGYILHVHSNHYTTNVKRNGVWWGVNDIGSNFATMVSDSGPMIHRGIEFTKDGKWDPTDIKDTAYPVVLLYKNLNRAWDVRFINNKPGVINNPGSACYALSPIVLFANIPEIVSTIVGKTGVSSLLRNISTTPTNPLLLLSSSSSDEEVVAVAISAVEDVPAEGRIVHSRRNKQTHRRHRKERRSRNTRRRRPLD